jgi:hypothetical protein
MSRCVMRGVISMSPPAMVCTAAMIRCGGVVLEQKPRAPAASAL